MIADKIEVSEDSDTILVHAFGNVYAFFLSMFPNVIAEFENDPMQAYYPIDEESLAEYMREFSDWRVVYER